MQTAQLEGITDDIASIAARAPDAIHQIAVLLQTGYGYLPQLQQLVTKAGSYLPQISQIVDKAAGYLPTILAVAQDPALPQLVQRVQTLKSLEKPGSSPSTPSTTPGVGLSKIVSTLDKYIWVRQHPGATIALGIGGAVFLVGAGVLIGRATKRRR